METDIQTRRAFLRKMALTSSVGALATSPWLSAFADSQQVSGSPSDRVRIGIIGTGSRGKQLLRMLFLINKASNIEVTALCDVYNTHLAEALEMCMKQNEKVKQYTHYQDMISKEKLDGVIIATPLHQHAHITIDCMEAGIHVFCEKSMERTMEKTKAMYDAHKRTGKVLQIGHQRLFNPIYLEGIQRIQNGDLGPLVRIKAHWHRNGSWRRPVPDDTIEMEHFINWRLYKEYSAGLLTELMSHQIQVANWVMQSPPISVMGTGSNVFWKDKRDVNDNVALIYSYDNDCQFIYDSMHVNEKYGIETKIFGRRGTFEFEANRYYSETPPPAPGILQLLNDMESGFFKKTQIGGPSWIAETARTDAGQPILNNTDFQDSALQLEAFAKYIRAGKAPDKLLKEGYNASIWTLLGEKAIETGEKQTLPEKYLI